MTVIVSDIRKSFQGVVALHATSFTVEDGELFVVLGPRGAGKSTMITSLAAPARLDAGTVEFTISNGAELSAHASGRQGGPRSAGPNSRAFSLADDVGVVFESVLLDPELTVRENVSFHASLRGLSGKDWIPRLNRLAALLGIAPLLDRRLGRLSYGESRRADLARALIHAPSVLFADEPTKGLDPHSSALVWGAIQEQHDQGTTIVLASEQAVLAEKADRVGILVDGRIRAIGSPDSLIAKYCPSVLALELTEPEACQQELLSYEIDMPDPDSDGHVAWAVDPATARDVISLLSERVVRFEFRSGTLDEVVRTLAARPAAPVVDLTEMEAQGTNEEYDQADFEGVIAPVWPEEDSEPYEVDESYPPLDVEFPEDEYTEISSEPEDEDEHDEAEEWDDSENEFEPEESEFEVEEGEFELEQEPEGERGEEGFEREEEPEFEREENGFELEEELEIGLEQEPGLEREPELEEAPEEAEEESYDGEAEGTDVADEPTGVEDRPPRTHWSKATRFADTGRRLSSRPAQNPAHVSAEQPLDAEEQETFFDDQPSPTEDLASHQSQPSRSRPEEWDWDLVEAGQSPTEAPDDQEEVAEVAEGFTVSTELAEIVRSEDERAREAARMDRLALVSHLLEDAVLDDPLPPFDEQFPMDHLPFVAQELSVPPPPRRTTWYEEMRRPIDEEMVKQARIKLAVEKRLEEARRRRTDELGED